MKRHFLYVLIPLSLNAQQPSNVVIDAENAVCDHLVSTGQNYYYVTTRWTPGFIDPVKLESRNRNGTLRFSTSVTKDETTRITDMIPLSDHAVLIGGYVTGCDYPGTDPGHFLMKLDSAGNVLFNVDFEPVTNWVWKTLHLTELPDSSYKVAGDSMLYHFSHHGAMLSATKMPFGNASQIMSLPNGDLLLNAFHQSAWKHLVVGSTGTILSSTAGGPSARYGFAAGNVVSLTGGKIETFPLSLNTVTVTSQLPPLTDLVTLNDSVYAISDNHEYYVLDANLAIVHSYSLPSPFRAATGLAVIGNQAAILSNCKSDLKSSPVFYSMPGQYGAITCFPKIQGFSYSRDIGVVAASCDSCAPIISYNPYAQTTFIDYYAHLRVTVKNYGPDLVTSFYLNDVWVTPQICGVEYMKQQFTGLSVPPGGTVQVLMQPYVLKNIGSLPGQSVPTMSGAVTFSLFTTAPDLQIDDAAGNDLGTSTVVYYITDVGQQMHDPGLAVYPNPFTDRLTFSGNDKIDAIRVFSAEGRMVHESFPGASEGNIQIENLPAGLYLLRLQSGNTTLLKKIARQ